MWTTQTKLFEQGDIKPMKYMKKLMTLLAVLTLALAMAVPAFAETTTTTYTIRPTKKLPKIIFRCL